MKNLTLHYGQREEPTMSSREFAEIIGKPHNDLLKAIRNMESAWEEATGGKFSLSEYTDSTGRKLPQFDLTKREWFYVGTKFNDFARAKLVLKWEQLEKEKLQPKSIKERYSNVLVESQQIIKELATTNEALEAKNEVLTEKLTEAAPKVEFTDVVLEDGTALTMDEFAKQIYNEGFFTKGRNTLYAWMRQEGYLMRSKDGQQQNIPYQWVIDSGYLMFKSRKIRDRQTGRLIKVANQVFITPKGQVYFVNKIKEYFNNNPFNKRA